MRWYQLLICALLQLLGLAFFFKGFFPPQVSTQGFASFPESRAHESLPVFRRLVLMVVDAMRSDFMFSSENSEMRFLHQLVREGNALPFTALANPPTVTLPRLKGITTGRMPSFLDAILNVADDNDNSQSLQDVDSWLRQFRSSRAGREVHFFGDDTWLKLFPHEIFFEKFDGTNSFFVSDFTEVDLNVTRHLKNELSDSSWDALILHYLGLDHIGHKGGPNSKFMKGKQIEMDKVLEKLYLTLGNESLIVLMGDHGMNAIGNHGGSSDGETHAGLALISPAFKNVMQGEECPISGKNDFQYFSSISQIDIVPTIASLFDFPIPNNNLGIVIPQILLMWGLEHERQDKLIQNCLQLMGVMRRSHSTMDPTVIHFEKRLKSLLNNEPGDNIEIRRFLEDCQQFLTGTATKFNLAEIIAGVSLWIVSLAFFLWNLKIFIAKSTSQGKKLWLAVFGACVIYGIHFHATSFIEEEHQIWWFVTVTFCTVCFFKSPLREYWTFGIVLILLRVIRAWSDQGAKNVTSMGISDILIAHPGLKFSLLGSTLAYLCYSAVGSVHMSSHKYARHWQRLGGVVVRAITIAAALACFAFKALQEIGDRDDTPPWLLRLAYEVAYMFNIDILEKDDLLSASVLLSRLFVYLFALALIVQVILGNERVMKRLFFSRLSVLFLAHHMRAEFIPILPVFEFLRMNFSKMTSKMESMSLRSASTALFVLCMQYLTFFSTGNTNQIASIDLSNAYNGVRTYSVLVVGFLVFVSNFAAPIFWSLSLLHSPMDASKDGSSRQSDNEIKFRLCLKNAFALLFYSLSGLSLFVSCINMRFHLFVWSVFSPRLLYFAAWLLFLDLGIDRLLCFGILNV